MSLNDIYALSSSEKLHIIDELWSRISDEDIVSPDWHGEVLRERAKRYENGEVSVVSLEEFKKQKK